MTLSYVIGDRGHFWAQTRVIIIVSSTTTALWSGRLAAAQTKEPITGPWISRKISCKCHKKGTARQREEGKFHLLRVINVVPEDCRKAISLPGSFWNYCGIQIHSVPSAHKTSATTGPSCHLQTDANFLTNKVGEACPPLSPPTWGQHRDVHFLCICSVHQCAVEPSVKLVKYDDDITILEPITYNETT